MLMLEGATRRALRFRLLCGGCRTDASTSTSRDHYEVLGVAKSASTSEIKKAFYTKSKLLHPDGRAYSTEEQKIAATQKFVELKTAYDVLRRPADRRLYDLRGSPEALAELRRRRQAGKYAYHGFAGQDYSNSRDWRSAFYTASEQDEFRMSAEEIREREKRQWKTIVRVTVVGLILVFIYNAGYWYQLYELEKRVNRMIASDEIARSFLRQSEFRQKKDDPLELENLARLLKLDVDDAHKRRMEYFEKNPDEIREEYRWFQALRGAEFRRKVRQQSRPTPSSGGKENSP